MESSDEFTNSIWKPAVGEKQERPSVVEHAGGDISCNTVCLVVVV